MVNDCLMQTIFRFLVAGEGSGGSETETSTYLQFKHAFPRCNGEEGGDLVLESSELMVGRLVRIFGWNLQSWLPWRRRRYTSLVRNSGTLSEGG